MRLILRSGVILLLAVAGAVLWPHAEPGAASGIQITAIAAGGDHACALTTAGGVQCWGSNDHGQVGDGSTTSRLTPVDVAGLTSGIVAVSAGDYHSCALTTAGGLKCWGYNAYGQLGDGFTVDRLTPVDVAGLTSGVAAVAAGYFHTCALTDAGGLKCWGWNFQGQLGDGTTTDRLAPVDVSGLTSGVAAVALGNFHTCARTTADGLKCWGYNAFTQLGDGTNTNSTTPVDVSGLGSGVAAVAGGYYHTCALTTAGGLKCWGYNASGQLGDGTTSDRATPVDVSGLASGVAAVATGAYSTCALTTAGGVKCWGQNFNGQLGDGSTTDHVAPADVSGLTSGMAAVTGARAGYACALSTVGTAKCWGYNADGQLGNGTATVTGCLCVPTPVDVAFDADLDGCADYRENGSNPLLGGLRDPKNPWDFYDTNGDRVIDLLNDIRGVISHWSPGGGPPYDPNYDRGPSAGPNAWNMTAPDGVIDLFNDIRGVIKQWNHDCR